MKDLNLYRSSRIKKKREHNISTELHYLYANVMKISDQRNITLSESIVIFS